MAATVTIQQTITAINGVLRKAPGYYSEYSCCTVSWEDVRRDTSSKFMSTWGDNLTDTRLVTRDGRRLFTVRCDNWDERLGKVKAEEVLMVVEEEGELHQHTNLAEILKKLSRFGSYAGLNVADLSDEALDQEVSIRFQTTFLPLQEEDLAIDFCPQIYSYQTQSDLHPRNLILLGTSQGIAVQQDGTSYQSLYHHSKKCGKIHRYWLEAAPTRHVVGESQVETEEEKQYLRAQGKASALPIGIAQMESRCNVLMTVQIPLEQEVKPKPSFYGNHMDQPPMLNVYEDCDEVTRSVSFRSAPIFNSISFEPLSFEPPPRMPTHPKQGTSSAARISRGSLVDNDWKGLSVVNPKRHPKEHVTVTIVTYHVCQGGMPTERDVLKAVDDLEALYESVQSKRLSER